MRDFAGMVAAVFAVACFAFATGVNAAGLGPWVNLAAVMANITGVVSLVAAVLMARRGS